MPGSLPVRRMCQVLGVARATAYRALPPSADRDMDLRDAIQHVAVAFPYYGSRMMTAELRRRHWRVNRKRVQRLMRADNLLCLRRLKAWHKYPAHGYPIYPNLAAEFEPNGIDQLWVADLTYIRLHWGFVYLAVIMDACSRRSLGWALGEYLEAELTLFALRMALHRRRPAGGLIHHSDRGVQYASNEYVALLREHGIQISMSRAGNPYDNGACERFIKTLKHNEIYLRDYEDIDDARRHVGRFIDDTYNHKRLHSALGYLPPAEFEANLKNDDSLLTPVLTECLT